ncbi:MAG: hypothetical protein GXP31_10545 [Kiritimatiellaeota bacterium]|nr:hypothetical protein [Kiritimatiellota bacterium]
MPSKAVSPKTISIQMAFRQCNLPPVQDALILGKQAPVGSEGVVRALQALSPGVYKLIRVEHDVIESILVRESDLRKISENDLVRVMIEHVGPIMDATDALNVQLDIRVTVSVELHEG